MSGNTNFHRKGYKSQLQRERTLHMEALEERALLSAAPLDPNVADDTVPVVVDAQQAPTDSVPEAMISVELSEEALALITTSAIAGYNANDVAKLQAFLEQTDSNGVKNSTKINSNYNVNDVSTWSGVTWTEVNGVKYVTDINWYQKDLAGLLDVSGCTALTSLVCESNQLMSLNLSGCTALAVLHCSYNQLILLDLSGCTALKELYCYSNQLKSLDVSKNTTLTNLYCASNPMTSLNVLGCTALTNLDCYSSQLTTLDVSGCTALKELDCTSNPMTLLDVSNNTVLKRLHCWSSNLNKVVLSSKRLESIAIFLSSGSDINWTFKNASNTTIGTNTISGNTHSPYTLATSTALPISAVNADDTQTISFVAADDVIRLRTFLEQTDSNGTKNGKRINYNYNANNIDTWTGVTWTEVDGVKRVTSIDWSDKRLVGSLNLSQCTELTYLNCRYNSDLVSLDVSGCSALQTLYCDNNHLTSMNVSGCTALQALYNHTNQLTALDVTDCLALSILDCGGNRLTSLDVSKCTALTQLLCGNNQLTALDVAANTALTRLDCYNNRLTALDVTSCQGLTRLDCGGNRLTALDVSKCTSLKQLFCGNNQLTALNLKANTELTSLECYTNHLAALDVSACTVLTSLNCGNNQLLAELNLTGCSKLNYLHCDQNQLTTLDVSTLTNLSELHCYSNPLTVLDVSNNLNLTTLSCWSTSLRNVWLSPSRTRSILLTSTVYSSQGWTIKNANDDVLGLDSYSLAPSAALPIYATNEDGTHTISFSETVVDDVTRLREFLEQTDANGVKNGYKINENYDADDVSTWTGVTWTEVDGVNRATSINWSNKGLVGSLNVLGCTALKELDCYCNQLTSLNVLGCTALTRLWCYANQLTSLDVSECTVLTELECHFNQLTSLNVLGCTALTKLWCPSNQLTSLDVSKCTALTTLSCDSNQLTSLDVSKNTKLRALYCDSNQLTSLDVSKNTALTRLWCHSNQLTSLDVSKNTALTELECSSNQLTSLDVSKNTELTYLSCYSNELTSLDVSKNTALKELYCYSSELTLLDVSKNTKLRSLYCWSANLNRVVLPSERSEDIRICLSRGSETNWTFKNTSNTTIGTSNVSNISYKYYNLATSTALPIYATNEDGTHTISFSDAVVDDVTRLREFLEQTDTNGVKNGTKINSSYNVNDTSTWSGVTWTEVDGVQRVSTIKWRCKNLVGALSLSGCTALTYLDCGGNGVLEDNQLTSLDVSGCTALTYLYCNYNASSGEGMALLDVSGCTALTSLSCRLCNLTSLDVSECTALTELSCIDNQLTRLDVSKNTALESLHCEINQLTELDVTENVKLTNLFCYDNELTELDVSKNTKLTWLDCSANLLTELDVSKNTELTCLDCYSNQLASLDVSKNTVLKELYCWNSTLSNVVLSSERAEDIRLNLYFGSYTNWTFKDADGDALGTNIAYYTLGKSAALPIYATNESETQTVMFTSDVLPLTAPTLSVSTNGSNAVVVTVGSVANASGYTLEYSTSSNFSNATTKSVSAGSTTISGLNANTTYYFRVMAVGAGNYSNSDYSAVKSAKTDTIQLAAPTLSVAANGSSAVSVTVGSVANASGYTLEYSTSSNFSNATTKSVSAGTSTISGLNANTTYYFRVMAIGEGIYSNSDYSAVKSAKTSTIKLTAPTLSVAANGSNAVSVTVGSVANASGYSLQYSTSANFSSVTTKSVSAGTTTISGLSANTTYYFRVRAIGTGSYTNSNYSTTKSVKTGTIQLAAPTLSVAASGSDAVTVTVGEVANASGYTLEYSANEDFSNAVSRNVSAGETAISGLNANTTYYFRVMAAGLENYSDSEFSAAQSATTDTIQLEAPTLNPANVQKKTVSFAWEAVENASGYLFEYKAAGADSWTVQTVTGTSTTFEGERNTTYTARVKALGVGNYADSAYSAEQSATIDGVDISIIGKKVTVSWEDASPAADAIRYRVAGTARWTLKKLKAGETTFSFNAQVGTNYEVEVLLDQNEGNLLKATAVVLDQAKLAANKNDIHDDTFQVSVTNYGAKNLAANATQAVLTVNGVQTVLDIENQQATGALASGGNVTFDNGLFTFTEMASNTQYKVQVSFSDGLSVSTASSALSVKTLKAPYLAPEITSAIATSDTTIAVTWETAYGKKTTTPAQKYTVQYSTDGVKWSNATTGATGNAFTIQRLKGGTVYQVRVLATKDTAFEASTPSEALVAETLALPKIALEKTSLKDDTFQLNVTNYQSTNLVKAAKVNVTSDKLGTAVIELQNGTGSAIFTNGTTVAFANGALTFAEVPSNTQQKLQVSFTLADCTTALSQAVTVKTLAAPYNKPVLRSAFAVSSTSITVEWETVYGKKSTTAAQAYTVQYSTDGVRWTNATTKATGTSFTITKLKANTKYLVAVIATKDQLFLASDPSDSLLVTTME